MSRDPRDFVEALGAISRLASLIPTEHVEAFLAETERMHAVMPILDPTAYRDIIHNPDSERWVRLVRAFLTFRREIDAIKGG